MTVPDATTYDFDRLTHETKEIGCRQQSTQCGRYSDVYTFLGHVCMPYG